MDAHRRLRQAIDQQQDRLGADVPADRSAAIIALLRIQEWRLYPPAIDSKPDIVTGRRLADLGGNKALQLCLESESSGAAALAAPKPADDGLVGWGERFLRECGRLAEAELVLAHRETGFMRLVEDGNGRFDAWVATSRVPAIWRERADIDWWAAWLVRRHERELDAPRSERLDAERGDPAHDANDHQLAVDYQKTMAYQLGYPPEAVIGGCAVQTYRDVLGRLMSLALQARDRGESPEPCSARSLVAAIAADLAVDPIVIGRAVAAFTLDRENAAYHAAVPGIAAAPLVRLDCNQLVCSLPGLTTEPFFFLTRELRRRDAAEYHNTAYLREDVFRRDIYALFVDERFVTSAGRTKLRRDDGDVRTDIDALIFDRKTGTLGLFELKSQDPFARSTAELARQRDNVLSANRQIAAILDWLKRHGADALLGRVDARTAKTFRVQKVYPFVLGRYLAHVGDGPVADRRAAWGTWPQLLRLLDQQPVPAAANPLASIFGRLTKDDPLLRPFADQPPREIAIGTARLVVHPSYAAFTNGG